MAMLRDVEYRDTASAIRAMFIWRWLSRDRRERYTAHASGVTFVEYSGYAGERAAMLRDTRVIMIRLRCQRKHMDSVAPAIRPRQASVITAAATAKSESAAGDDMRRQALRCYAAAPVTSPLRHEYAITNAITKAQMSRRRQTGCRMPREMPSHTARRCSRARARATFI